MFGIWFQLVLCGYFGGNVILVLLKILRDKYMLVGTLFRWSRIWDLQCISIYDFLLSVCISS